MLFGKNVPNMTELREFDAAADTIGSIRGYVQDVLLRVGAADEAIDAAVLCTSELATNALLHGDGPIGVTLDITAKARIEIHDRNERPPVLREAGAEDDTGRGLLLVTMFANSWGYEAQQVGKSVWFEIDLRPEPVDDAPPAVERRRWRRRESVVADRP